MRTGSACMAAAASFSSYSRARAALGDPDVADPDRRRGSTSRATPARPAAARMRPQFGSPPWRAVLTSGDSATVRAMRSASAVVRAPSTRTSATRVAPSPSRTSISREPARGLGRAPPRRRRRPGPGRSIGGAPRRAAREHDRAVVGRGVAVDGDAVEARADGVAERRRSSGGATAASVVKKASMVAMFGAIMPAPLAIAADARRSRRRPRTRPRPPSACVSVVMIARAASAPPSRESAATARGDAGAQLRPSAGGRR